MYDGVHRGGIYAIERRHNNVVDRQSTYTTVGRITRDDRGRMTRDEIEFEIGTIWREY